MESEHKLLGVNTENKMVIRGGAAVAFNRIPTVLFANSRGNPPFMARYTICCGTNNEFSTPFADGQILYALGANNTPFSYPTNPALILTFNPATGIPTNTISGTKEVEIWGAPAKVDTPYIYAYSLEGQYSLPAKLTGTLGYQGSASRKLVRIVNERFEFPNTDYFAKNVFFPTPDTTASYNALLATPFTAVPRASSLMRITDGVRALTSFRAKRLAPQQIRPIRLMYGRNVVLRTMMSGTVWSPLLSGIYPFSEIGKMLCRLIARRLATQRHWNFSYWLSLDAGDRSVCEHSRPVDLPGDRGLFWQRRK